MLLRLHRGLPFTLGGVLGLLDLVQRAFLVLHGPFEGGVVFLHVEQRFFHHRTLHPYPGHRLRFDHHGSRHRGRRSQVPIDEPAEQPTAQQGHRGTPSGPRHKCVEKEWHVTPHSPYKKSQS